MNIRILAQGICIVPETDFETDYLKRLSKHGIATTIVKTLDTYEFYGIGISSMVAVEEGYPCDGNSFGQTASD